MAPKPIDISGQRFGRLVAVKRLRSLPKTALWLCRCDCGNTKECKLSKLRNGDNTSCGCSKELIDLSGARFGHLIAIERSDKARRGGYYWLCRCDCGEYKKILGISLSDGVTKSCGCLQKKTAAKLRTTHGKSNSPEYRAWVGMRSRCNNPNKSNYRFYGARGVSVCKRWGRFENFFEDMGNMPNGFTLDRIDPNGNYEPSNCRWASWETQYKNKRTDWDIKNGHIGN